MCCSVALSTFTLLCNHHHHPSPELFSPCKTVTVPLNNNFSHKYLTPNAIFLLDYLFNKILYYIYQTLKVVLGSQQNWEESTEISHVSPAPTHTQPPPLSTHPPVIINESALTHHHPKSIVYIVIHSWCCTFMGLNKCIKTYPLL